MSLITLLRNFFQGPCHTYDTHYLTNQFFAISHLKSVALSHPVRKNNTWRDVKIYGAQLYWRKISGYGAKYQWLSHGKVQWFRNLGKFYGCNGEQNDWQKTFRLFLLGTLYNFLTFDILFLLILKLKKWSIFDINSEILSSVIYAGY